MKCRPMRPSARSRVLTVVLAARDNMRGLATLLTPAFVLFVGWLCVTVLLSFDPGTSIRRFTLTACVIAVTASLPLLAKSQAEIMRWFTIAALVLLATCYLGILLAPHLDASIWRPIRRSPVWPATGAARSATRTVAAAIMAMLLFLGIYFIRAGGWITGIAVIGLSLAVPALCRRQKLAGAVLSRCCC